MIADLVRNPAVPGDPDRVERLRDPSHGTMQTVTAISRLLGEVTAAESFDVERPLRTWLEQSRTPEDVAAQISAELRSELAGGPVTGMRPLLVDGELWFTQTWAHLSTRMPRSHH